MTILVHELGKGHSTIQKIEQVLGVNGMSEKSYRNIQRDIQLVGSELMSSNFMQAAKAIRTAYLADDDETLNIIDFCVLSIYCSCTSV